LEGGKKIKTTENPEEKLKNQAHVTCKLTKRTSIDERLGIIEENT